MRSNIIILTVIVFIFSAISSLAQYNTLSILDAKSNPGNLNLEDDMLNPMPGTGWTTIYSNSSATPAWSSNVTLPFTFLFNNINVNSFKVSNSGILTFNTSVVNVPSYINTSLPDPTIPDNSICIWGIRGEKNYASVIYNYSARTPIIRTKVFGNSPNRQLWISFTGFTSIAADTAKAILTNWSIVLQETSNYIYVIDQSTFPFAPATGGFKPDTINVNLTIGVQLDSTTAFAIKESPNVHSTVLNPRQASNLSFSCYDNGYYIFRPDLTTPSYDVGILKINLGQYTNGKSSGINMTGSLINCGKTSLSSVRINYSVDGGVSIDTTLNGLNVPTGGIYTYTTAKWNPSASADYHIKIWGDHLNGSHTDEYHFNDTAEVITSYMKNPPKRKVLVEEFTGTWCGHCPRALSAMAYTLAHQPDAIGYACHVENDPMTNYYTQQLAKVYAWGYPNGMVDRTCFSEYGEIRTAMSFPPTDDYIHGIPFMAKVSKQLLVPTPVSVDISNTFDSISRLLTVTITATFEAPATGDLRLNAIIVEDSISGGVAYNQANYMAGDTSYPYWGKQPGTISGFYHRHVARYNMADTTNIFGTPGIIPPSVSRGQTFNKTYVYVLPATWDKNKIEVIAFVSRFNTDNTKGTVLNANKASMLNNGTGIMESKKPINSFIIYPSPSYALTTIYFNLNTEQEVKLEVYNMVGEKVYSDNLGKMGIGKHTTNLDVQKFSKGLYFVTLNLENNLVTKKLFIVK